jgi:predicted TIM-barrel fold metal-dependent hydrolase
LRDLADAFPDTQIILDFPIPLGAGDHSLESPDDRDFWRNAVRSVAQPPNIAAKLGGFGMGIAGLRLGERDEPPGSQELCELMRPYIDFTIETFGADRCLIGSNFPVDKGSFSYTVFWNAFKRLLRGFTESERDAMLSLNATRYYRLGAT